MSWGPSIAAVEEASSVELVQQGASDEVLPSHEQGSVEYRGSRA